MSPQPAGAERHRRPCVVPYLYDHAPDEVLDYPSARAGHDAKRVAWRYLECVLVQAASLRLRCVDCDIAFVSNASNQRAAISRRELRLLDQIKHYGVEICETEYRHAPARAIREPQLRSGTNLDGSTPRCRESEASA